MGLVFTLQYLSGTTLPLNGHYKRLRGCTWEGSGKFCLVFTLNGYICSASGCHGALLGPLNPSTHKMTTGHTWPQRAQEDPRQDPPLAAGRTPFHRASYSTCTRGGSRARQPQPHQEVAWGLLTLGGHKTSEQRPWAPQTWNSKSTHLKTAVIFLKTWLSKRISNKTQNHAIQSSNHWLHPAS